ncbi:hypothetical protein BSL78_17514 [Apostichopus japonicus]|uniref:Reverse transcriptase domain-containing protein n=1 Tax=Stichopus japonicus TaxID=307972 RepID=A0A2G8KC98_STIJA|nr:hypothetical protein BSL78_17514 [Apostichopus japonicus]
MGHFGRGQVGIGDDLTRVQDRVHLRPALREGEDLPNTHRPRPTSSTRRGSISLAGKAGNCRGVGRGGTPLPLLPVSNTKTGRSWRPILNLKPLNKNYVEPKRFRMETLNLILPLLRKGMWAASVDLQDAYLHIPIHPRHQRYLAFQYAGRRFTFRSLPFGLSTAPRVFTRVAGTVIAYLRKKE